MSWSRVSVKSWVVCVLSFCRVADVMMLVGYVCALACVGCCGVCSRIAFVMAWLRSGYMAILLGSRLVSNDVLTFAPFS